MNEEEFLRSIDDKKESLINRIELGEESESLIEILENAEAQDLTRRNMMFRENLIEKFPSYEEELSPFFEGVDLLVDELNNDRGGYFE